MKDKAAAELHLTEALEGLQLTNPERRIVGWLSEMCDASTIEAVASMLSKAFDVGYEACAKDYEPHIKDA